MLNCYVLWISLTYQTFIVQMDVLFYNNNINVCIIQKSFIFYKVKEKYLFVFNMAQLVLWAVADFGFKRYWDKIEMRLRWD